MSRHEEALPDGGEAGGELYDEPGSGGMEDGPAPSFEGDHQAHTATAPPMAQQEHRPPAKAPGKRPAPPQRAQPQPQPQPQRSEAPQEPIAPRAPRVPSDCAC
jgi:hypothetical protein